MITHAQKFTPTGASKLPPLYPEQHAYCSLLAAKRGTYEICRPAQRRWQLLPRLRRARWWNGPCLMVFQPWERCERQNDYRNLPSRSEAAV